MRLQFPQPATFNRLAMGLLAGVCWIASVTLFGRQAIALQASLGREGWLWGGAGGLMGVLTFVIMSKMLKNKV